jgi:hypothetical protein
VNVNGIGGLILVVVLLLAGIWLWVELFGPINIG